jgi:hypothetical protein
VSPANLISCHGGFGGATDAVPMGITPFPTRLRIAKNV